MSDDDLVLRLSALGHPIRLSLYRLLVAAGPAGRGPVVLAAAADVPRNLVSYHLQPLVAAGLASSERRGRDVNYRIEPAGLNMLAAGVLNLSAPADVASGRARSDQ